MIQARDRVRVRRQRQVNRLEPSLWLVLAVVGFSVVGSRPRPSLHGVGLVVTIASIVCGGILAAAAAGRWPRRTGVQTAALPMLLGYAGIVLVAAQPAALAEAPVSAAVMIAFLQLRPLPACVVAIPLTIGLTIASASTSKTPVNSATGSVLLCVVFAVTALAVRQAGHSADRAELLLAELEDAREAEAAAAAAAERGRIARELHDVLAQSLSALAIQLEGARKLAARDGVSPALAQIIERSGELTREGLVDARYAVSTLRGDVPATVEQLTELVQRAHRDLGVAASLTVNGGPRPLSAEVNLAIYRGAQEALTNAARYAGGAPVTVRLDYGPGQTTLRVQDTGAGNSAANGVDSGGQPAAVFTRGGNGLRGMRERAEKVGGTTRIGPNEHGWLVEMEIPA